MEGQIFTLNGFDLYPFNSSFFIQIAQIWFVSLRCSVVMRVTIFGQIYNHLDATWDYLKVCTIFLYVLYNIIFRTNQLPDTKIWKLNNRITRPSKWTAIVNHVNRISIATVYFSKIHLNASSHLRLSDFLFLSISCFLYSN